MLTFQDIEKIVLDVECKPYVFRLGCIQCIRLGRDGDKCFNKTHAWFLQCRLWRKDTITGKEGWGSGRKYLLSGHMVKSEIVKTALSAALAYGEHEIREGFKYQGYRLFGPHISTEAMVGISDITEARPGNE